MEHGATKKGQAIFFISSDGEEYVFQGEDENGMIWFRNTKDKSADYVSADNLIEDPTMDLPLGINVKAAIRAAGFNNLNDLHVACEGAYKLGLNPLPRIREMLKGLPLTVNFAFFGNGGTFFDAAPRSATLGIFLHDGGEVSTQLFDNYTKGGRWFAVQAVADIDVSLDREGPFCPSCGWFTNQECCSDCGTGTVNARRFKDGHIDIDKY